MKKFFVIVLILLAGLSSYSQNIKLSQKQIYETIFSENNLNHLSNQSLIYPGQTLRYLINGALPVSFVVKNGENQWSILNNFEYSETDIAMAYLTKDVWKLQSIVLIPDNVKKVEARMEGNTPPFGFRIMLFIIFLSVTYFCYLLADVFFGKKEV